MNPDGASADSPLRGRVALITGGAKRLGRAIALGLAREGVSCVLHYSHSEREAEETAGEIRAIGAASAGAGARAWTLAARLEDPGEAAALFPRALEAAGEPVDILINNASIFPKDRLDEVTLERAAENLQVNALAPLALARAFAAQKRPGHILNLLDSRIADYDREHVSYHLSKRALFALTRMMALEFAPLVAVNALAPGLILPPPGETEDYLRALAHTNPLRRVGSPAGVVDAALFLLRSDFITGQVIFLDGGRFLRGSVYGL